MLKSLQWKIVTMFVLIVLSVMMIAGTFLLTWISDFYHYQFTNDMKAVFADQQLTDQLRLLAFEQNGGIQMPSILDAYSGPYRLGISSNRNYYILDGKTGDYVSGSDTQVGGLIEKTPNIIAALSGFEGDVQNTQVPYMDYAVPISLVFGLFLSGTITKPIVSLTKRAERLAAGELTETATVKKTDDEIGILSNTFSYMAM